MDVSTMTNVQAASCTRRRFLGAAGGAAVAAWLGCVAAPAWAQEVGSASTPAQNWAFSIVKELLPAEAPDVRDDFYTAANYEWLASTELPEGESSWNIVKELGVTVRERMLDILRNPEAGNDDEAQAALLFAQASDQDARDAAGMGSIYGDTIAAILAASTLAELTELLSTSARVAYESGIVTFGVLPDEHNATVNACHIGSTYLTLSDASEYAALTETGSSNLKAHEDYWAALLECFGVAHDEAQQIAADSRVFEALIAPGMYDLATMQRSDQTEVRYNPTTRAELEEMAGAFPLGAIMDAQGYGVDGPFILDDPGWLKQMAQVYTEENVAELRAYLAVGLLDTASAYAGSDFIAIGTQLENDLYGSAGSSPAEVLAYECCGHLIGELMGSIYARRYLPEETKSDVEAMAVELRGLFAERLEAADWLGEGTRAAAIEKIKALKVYVGYPESFQPWEFVIDETLPFIDNAAAIREELVSRRASCLGKPADADLWVRNGVYAHTANFYYIWASNAVIVPAGVLQDPYYDPQASRAVNMAGVGTSIAGRMAASLCDTGSLYDKDGNLSDWWSAEDRAAFEERTGAITEYLGGITVFDEQKVNGPLVVGMMISDLGGMATVLDLIAREDEPDYDMFFRAFAAPYRIIKTMQRAESDLVTEPRAPSNLRINVIAQQFQQFYDTYGVVEGDGMYLAPEQRMSVW